MARRDDLQPDPADTVRVGYSVIAFAAIGSVLIAALVLAGPAPRAHATADGLAPASPGLAGRSKDPSTVEEALGLAGPPTRLEDRRAEAVAVLTTRCMAALGIAWLAQPEPPPPIPDDDLDPVAWAERWGFGVSTSVGAVAPGVEPDPAMTALAALPPAERSRVLLALDGDGTAPGCRQRATEEVMGLRDRSLAPLRPDLDRLDRAIAADPAMTRVLSRWRACIQAASIDDTEHEGLGARLAAQFAASVAGHPRPSALATLQAEERRIATAVARCEMEYITVRAIVARPHEAELVGRLGDRLRRIGAEIRAAEAALPTLPATDR